MDFTLHPNEGLHYIRSVSSDGIQVNDSLYKGALILSADTLVENWPVKAAEQLSEELLQPVLDMEPDLLLLGTGSTQVFLDPKLHWFLLSTGLGVEVMTTEAACRTFNVVMSEGRNAVAALLPLNRAESSD